VLNEINSDTPPDDTHSTETLALVILLVMVLLMPLMLPVPPPSLVLLVPLKVVAVVVVVPAMEVAAVDSLLLFRNVTTGVPDSQPLRLRQPSTYACVCYLLLAVC
jgi:hypothetical protein